MGTNVACRRGAGFACAVWHFLGRAVVLTEFFVIVLGVVWV
jgi:hypothetical protein